MEVTQHEIDAAITKANESLRKLYLSIETTLKAGYALPEEKIQEYNNLKEALFLLSHSSDLLAQDCITTKDVWIQINYVNETNCSLPIIQPIIDAFNWLITNSGKDILTNNNYKIKTS